MPLETLTQNFDAVKRTWGGVPGPKIHRVINLQGRQGGAATTHTIPVRPTASVA